MFLAAPELGTIECRGSEVRSWLNGLVTCDLVPRKLGEGAFGLCVGKTGKVLAELYIALLAEDHFLLGLRRPVLGPMMEHFDRHLVMEDVAIADVSHYVTAGGALDTGHFGQLRGGLSQWRRLHRNRRHLPSRRCLFGLG